MSQTMCAELQSWRACLRAKVESCRERWVKHPLSQRVGSLAEWEQPDFVQRSS